MDVEKVDKIIEKFNSEKSALTSILYEIQVELGYLHQDVLKRVAEKLEISMTQLFGVVTFYKIFHLEPRGRQSIHICMGTACHVRGAPRILEEFERGLDIKAGETTEDQAFTLEKVNCLGCCAIGPVVVVDDTYYGQMNSAKVTPLIKDLKGVGKN